MEGVSSGDDLLPGELCTQSGIYQVTHHAHRVPHNALVQKGDRFPRCNECGDAVRFRLVKQAGQPGSMRTKHARKKSAGKS